MSVRFGFRRQVSALPAPASYTVIVSAIASADIQLAAAPNTSIDALLKLKAGDFSVDTAGEHANTSRQIFFGGQMSDYDSSDVVGLRVTLATENGATQAFMLPLIAL